jgi:hypothetical protein
VVAKGDSALQLKGRRVPMPASLEDCRGARVVQGQVTACTSDAKGQPVCRTFDQGQAIDARPFGGGGQGTMFAALDRLLRINRAGADSLSFEGTMAWQSRGAEPLLPTKTVLLLDGRLLVDFSEPEMLGVEAVEIRRDSVSGPLVVSAPRTAGPAAIPTASLSDGPSYWAVPLPAQRPTQSPKPFNLAPPQERQDALAKLQAFDRQQAGPLATAMMRAAWLAQENYDYDALVTMKAIGMRVR